MENYKTSDDVLAAINQASAGLPEGEEPEEEQYSSAPSEVYSEDGYSDEEHLADYLEQDAVLKQQWRDSEAIRMKDEFGRTGVVPRSMNFEEWQLHREVVQPQQDLQKALAEDIEDLVQRYPKSSAGFLKKLRRGEIQPPENIEEIDNGLEAWFIDSITQEEFRRMDSDAQRELFDKEGEERKPLRTRSLDIAEPRRVKPVAKPRAKQTFSLPELDQDDINLMMQYLRKVRPEKFRVR